MMKILKPTRETKEPAQVLLPALDSLQGKVIAFLDNGWPSVSTIFTKLDALLRTKHKVSKTFKEAVPMSEPAPEELLDAVAKKCDAVIVGLGN